MLGDFKGEAAGIGPAVMWVPLSKDKGLVKDLVISAKWLYEYYAKHRLKGNHLFLNFTLGFES